MEISGRLAGCVLWRAFGHCLMCNFHRVIYRGKTQKLHLTMAFFQSVLSKVTRGPNIEEDDSSDNARGDTPSVVVAEIAQLAGDNKSRVGSPTSKNAASEENTAINGENPPKYNGTASLNSSESTLAERWQGVAIGTPVVPTVAAKRKNIYEDSNEFFSDDSTS